MDYDLLPRAHAPSHSLTQASLDHDQTLSEIEAPGFVSNVAVIRSSDGGALRTFNGGLAHENGWYPSAKAGRLLHYEGIAQLEFVIRSEVDFNVARLATESVRFEFPSS